MAGATPPPTPGARRGRGQPKTRAAGPAEPQVRRRAPLSPKRAASPPRRTGPPVEPRLTKARVADALLKTGGLLNIAANALRCSHLELRLALRRWPTLLQVKEEAKEAALDGAEWALIRAAKQGEPWAVQWFLKHQGQERGYAEVARSEHQERVRVEVTYTEDALGAARPATTVTPLPPPSVRRAPGADLPRIEVVEAESQTLPFAQAADTVESGEGAPPRRGLG
jgi:hypothetical protein